MSASRPADTLGCAHGDVAQLGERRVRNAKVVGSNPIVSIYVSHAEHATCVYLSASGSAVLRSEILVV